METRAERQKLYNSTAWRKIRKEVLKRQPLCQACGKYHRLTPATVADHLKPWETAAEFYGHGKKIEDHFQGLCKSCHREKLSEDMLERKKRRLFKIQTWEI